MNLAPTNFTEMGESKVTLSCFLFCALLYYPQLAQGQQFLCSSIYLTNKIRRVYSDECSGCRTTSTQR
jgi:hypothetical protein